MLSPITVIKSSTAWSRLPISYRGAIIIAIPAICLLATLGAWAWSRQLGRNILDRIDHTEAVIDKSNRLMLILLNAETGVRGYQITHREEFLDPYRYAQSNLPATVQELDRLLKDNREQTQQWKEIQRLIKQEMGLFEQKIQQFKQQPESSVTEQDRALVYQGKQVMDSIRKAIGELQAQEQALLTQEQTKLRNVRRITTIIQWASAWISAFAYWAAVYLFNRLDQDLREREIQLRESNIFIDTITTKLVDGVMTLNPQNQIESFNPAASAIFGYEPCEVIGKDLTVLMVDGDLDEAEKEEKIKFWHSNLLETDRRWQTTGYRKDGSIIPIEISVSEIEPDDQLLVIVRDISESEATKAKLKSRADELARLSAILAKANTELEKQNQELDKFAYVASHDLKAPLRAIASLSEWIEEDLEDKLSGETLYQMKLLRGRVHRLEELINGLLAYSRVGRVKTDIETVNVQQLVNEVIDSIDPPEGFRFEISTNLPVFQAHKIPLRQVFFNLISNAVKHHDCPIGVIKISVAEFPDYYKFSVTDDGPGIPPEYHEKIFVIFQTLYPRDTKENTGIGLSIVKKILDNQGGTIDLESSTDDGTTFYFTWPKTV